MTSSRTHPESHRSPSQSGSATARQRVELDCGGEPGLTPEASDLLASKLREGALSARGLGKVRRVAKTVACLAGEDEASFAHVSEALSLRAGRAAVVA